MEESKRRETDPETRESSEDPGQRLIEYWKKEGEKAQEMEKQMQRGDSIEMKEEIEKRLKQVWEMKESLQAAEAEVAEAPPGRRPSPLRSGRRRPGEETETRTEGAKSKTESIEQCQLTPV